MSRGSGQREGLLLLGCGELADGEQRALLPAPELGVNTQIASSSSSRAATTSRSSATLPVAAEDTAAHLRYEVIGIERERGALATSEGQRVRAALVLARAVTPKPPEKTAKPKPCVEHAAPGAPASPASAPARLRPRRRLCDRGEPLRAVP